MKIKMKDGHFIDVATGEILDALTGKVTSIMVVRPEGAAERVQITLTEGEGENAVQKTLDMKKYGDASLKILRCLYGISEIILGKDLRLEFEAREGHGALIHVSANGEELMPLGTTSPYAYEKNLMIDKILGVLLAAVNYKDTILVFRNADGVYPDNVDEVVDYIRQLKATGRDNELTIKKTVFGNAHTANGYRLAISDLFGLNVPFRVYSAPEDVDAIWGAYNEVGPDNTETTAEEAPGISPEAEC